MHCKRGLKIKLEKPADLTDECVFTIAEGVIPVLKMLNIQLRYLISITV